MKITVELEDHDINAMHDVIFDVTGVKPSRKQVEHAWAILPENIQQLGVSWGCNDTVFRDAMHEHLSSMLDVHNKNKGNG